LNLLGDVEAVEEHQRRRRLVAGGLRCGMHEQRRQYLVAVRHLDRLDARPLQHRGAVGERFHRLLVHRGRARAVLQEALADLVVMRGAHQACGRGERVALLLFVATAGLDDVTHPGPFLEPGAVVADLVL
jgi:hypothetical protein